MERANFRRKGKLHSDSVVIFQNLVGKSPSPSLEFLGPDAGKEHKRIGMCGNDNNRAPKRVICTSSSSFVSFGRGTKNMINNIDKSIGRIPELGSQVKMEDGGNNVAA